MTEMKAELSSKPGNSNLIKGKPTSPQVKSPLDTTIYAPALNKSVVRLENQIPLVRRCSPCQETGIGVSAVNNSLVLMEQMQDQREQEVNLMVSNFVENVHLEQQQQQQPVPGNNMIQLQ